VVLRRWVDLIDVDGAAFVDRSAQLIVDSVELIMSDIQVTCVAQTQRVSGGVGRGGGRTPKQPKHFPENVALNFAAAFRTTTQ
jgi:hypothetical protein